MFWFGQADDTSIIWMMGILMSLWMLYKKYEAISVAENLRSGLSYDIQLFVILVSSGRRGFFTANNRQSNKISAFTKV